MKNLKLLGLLLVLSFTLIACSNKSTTYDETIQNVDLAKAQSEFTNIQDGGFYVDNTGKVVSPSEAEGKKVVEWYFEPVCPGCLKLETEAKTYLHEVQGENTLIKYYPISFLGKSQDNPAFVTYSDKMTGIMLSMAQHDPDLVQKFIKSVMSEVYVSLHYTKETHLPEFEKSYKELGGQNWDKIATDMSKGTVIAANTLSSLRDNEDMKAKAGGRLSTPLLYEVGADATTVVNTDDTASIKPMLTELLK